MLLYIQEEYGYREWLAEVSEEEFTDLKRRWQTMRGLFCSVPVQLIIPQAREMEDKDFEDLRISPYDKGCHIHECDDSYLEEVDYDIPEDESFWLDGKSYSHQDIYAWIDKNKAIS